MSTVGVSIRLRVGEGDGYGEGLIDGRHFGARLSLLQRPAGPHVSERLLSVANLRLPVMPFTEDPPSGAMVLEPVPDRLPVIEGDGQDSYLCGSCRVVLVENVHPREVDNTFIRCPHCQAMNEVNL